MIAICTPTSQSLSTWFSVLPQVCLSHLSDSVPLCGCGEGAARVSVCICVCEGVGPVGASCQASGAQAWSLYVPRLFIHMVPTVCVYLFWAPEAGARCMTSFLTPTQLSSRLIRDLSLSKVLTGDQEFQPEAKWELPLNWETKAQKCKNSFSHKAKQWQGQY